MPPRFVPSPSKMGDAASSEGKKLRQTTLYTVRTSPRRPQDGGSPSPRKRARLDNEPTKTGLQDSEQDQKLKQEAGETREDEKEPRALSPSPQPPRLPSDFLQVTSKSFLESTSTAIPGVHYQANFISSSTSRRWYDSLRSLPQWYQPTLSIYGRQITQSRSIIAFSKQPDLTLKYSGTEVEMHTWPEVLREMERKCREVVGEEVRFNHAMLNYYADGDTHIGRHSDNLENKVILTVSLGAPRTWVMTKRPPRGAKAAAKKTNTKLPPQESHRWTAGNGSLLLMQGDCQQDWYHEIPKEKKVKEGRISITFRQLVYD